MVKKSFHLGPLFVHYWILKFQWNHHSNRERSASEGIVSCRHVQYRGKSSNFAGLDIDAKDNDIWVKEREGMGSLKAKKKSNKVTGKKNQNASEFEMTSHPSTVGYCSFLVSPSLTRRSTISTKPNEYIKNSNLDTHWHIP